MSGKTLLGCAGLFFLCTACLRAVWEPACFVPAAGQSRLSSAHKTAVAAAKRRPGGAAVREGMQLTRLITGSTSADALLTLLESELAKPLFNVIHVTAALTTLAKLQRSVSKKTQKNGQVAALTQVATELLQRGTVSARQVSNIFWSVAKLHGSLPQLRSLEPALLEAVTSCAADMQPQGVANTIWACATLRLQSRELQQVLPHLAEQATAVAGDCLPQNLANMFWSAATLREAAPELLAVLPVLQVAAMDKVKDFNAQGVANTLWATATLQKLAPSLQELLPALINRAQEVGPSMKGQGLANCVWAAATLRRHHTKFEELLPKFMTLVADRKDLRAQALANVIWGAGQLRLTSAPCREASQRLLGKATVSIDSFTSQDVANTCLGAALTGLVDKDFMLAAARRTALLAPGTSDRSANLDLPQVVLAFAKLGFRARAMLTVVSERMSRALRQTTDWGLCALLWSYEELDPDELFLTFRFQLRKEAARRGLSKKQIESSQHGPRAFRRTR